MKDSNKKFREEILTAVSTTKGDVADAIGMPDEQDKIMLTRIIQRFNEKNPGVLDHTIATARQEYHAGRYGQTNEFKGEAVVNKGSRMIYAFELPEVLHHAIEEVFPSMFRSKKHLRWFRKNFYQMTISGKR